MFDSADHAATPLQPADVRQRLLAHLESDRRGARGARRGARRRPRGARRGDRHGGADARAAHARAATATTSSPRARSTAAPTRSSRVTFAQFGIDATFVDADDPDAFRAALKPNTKAVYAETIGNPQLNVCDIAALADVAHGAGIPLVIDNTLASPYLCRPFEHGADIVIHSVTKYLGGHGTTMGGIVVESGKFPWDNGNFPQMTEPSRGYHGVRFYETFGDFGFTMKARMETMRTLGPTLVAAVGVPAAAGHRDAASAHAAALRIGARGRAASRRASGRRMGELPAACPATATSRSRAATCRAARAAS